MRLHISLQDADMVVHEFEVDSENFMEVSIIEYEGNYYTYGGSGGAHFNRARFNKVSPPTKIK